MQILAVSKISNCKQKSGNAIFSYKQKSQCDFHLSAKEPEMFVGVSEISSCKQRSLNVISTVNHKEGPNAISNCTIRPEVITSIYFILRI